MALKIMILGFILITAILILKYKPVYEVKTESEILGYVENSEDFSKMINDEILSQTEETLESISLKEEPKYELKLIERTQDTNEYEVLYTLNENAVRIYKYYSIALNDKTTEFVDTLEEAKQIVEDIKEEYNDKDIQLQVNELYTEDKDSIDIESIKIAEASLEKEAQKILDEKAAKEALARINGINISVLPVSGTISSRYGAVSSIRSGAHTGLDIACSSGTKIKVVAKGTVTFASYNGSYGNLIKISHGNGIETWYAHCSAIYVKVGDKVSAGDVIGAVGSTGNSTGPHLHLEIRIDGSPVNPQKYLYK